MPKAKSVLLAYPSNNYLQNPYFRFVPANKSAISRYRVIDEALRNKQRKYPSKSDLIELISQRLDQEIGVRTLEKDLQDMRESPDLNYYAPISYNKAEKGYYYSEPDYSISGIPITEEDLKQLKFAAKIFTRFKNIPYLAELYRPIQQLERIIRVGKNTGQWLDNSIVQLEVPQQEPDMQMFENLVQCILKKQIVNIRYQRFGHAESNPFKIHPYLLKEYKNRWYLVALNVEQNDVRIYGLDRITTLKELKETHEDDFDAEEYFRYSLGITVINNEEPATIELLFSPEDAHYVLSSPIHPGQKILKNDKNGLHVQLTLHRSYELTMLIRSYGSGVNVLQPDWLREEIMEDAKKVVKASKALEKKE